MLGSLCLFVLITSLEISQLSEDTFFFSFFLKAFLPFCNGTVFGEWDLIAVFYYLKKDHKKGRAAYMGQEIHSHGYGLIPIVLRGKNLVRES